jgi:hypothetical protein
MLKRMSVLVRSFRLATEYHGDPAFAVEAHHHVGAFVRDPDVVLGIDPNRMRVRPCIEVVTDLAYKPA